MERNMIQVYVQELATYNNGIGVGKWINVDSFESELEELLEEATEALKEHGYYYGVDAEEWEIFDYECEANIDIKNFYQDIETLKKLNDILLECDETQIKIIDYLLDEGYGVDQLDSDLISEVFIYESWDYAIEDFIEHFLCIENNSNVYTYLDYEKIQRDLEIEGYSEYDGQIFYTH